MNIVEKMEQDVANLTVSEEIKLLQESFRLYRVNLNYWSRCVKSPSVIEVLQSLVERK